MTTLTRFTVFCSVFLALLLIAEPVSAQYFGRNKVQYETFDFQQFQTDHFEVYYYPEKQEAIQDVARMAERWYNRHSQTFLRQFTERKPLIFYANDTDFQQTNVLSGQIGQGTGGVTESLKERVVMPLTGSYSETDHVLGHELVHSFQYDIALRNENQGFSLRRLPLWLVEGMAEYLSVGREDSHTAMWLRDAALRDDLPSIRQMTQDMRYFPYRFGQAYMAYVGGKYGDPAVTNLYKMSGRVGVDSAFVYALGITTDSLSNEWQEAVKDTYMPLMEGRTDPLDSGRLILGGDGDQRELNVSPAVSPDGQYIAFISQRDLFTINLYIADAETGEVLQQLRGTTADPHFDALRFIDSAGSWSPDGRRFAFITFVQGQNEIAVLDVESGSIQRRVRVDNVDAIRNPAWSPDGQSIAFSGMEGGLSDLYLFNLESKEVRQLTNDRYAALQPAWSPDGRTIAFTTDRGPSGTDFETLQFGKMRIGLLDTETLEFDALQPFPRARHHNPQFSPDGNSLYFISDRDGFKDVYRQALEEDETYQVTNVKTGISGITALSPAMTVSSQSGRMAFSVFNNSGYSIMSLEPEETLGEPVEPLEDGIATASLLPPVHAVNEGLVANYLRDSVSGLPQQLDFDTQQYSPRLTLDYVAPPSVGVGVTTGGMYGTRGGLAGGVGFYFSDMLGHRTLTIAAQAQGTFKDIGGQVAYVNREYRFNYGLIASHIPYLWGGVQPVYNDQGQLVGVVRVLNRIFNSEASALASYPFTTTRRIDVSAGISRLGFDREAEFMPIAGGGPPQRMDLEAPDALYFFQADAAYVGDYSYFGFTSPVQGGRYRFGISPRVGTFSYAQALADYRRYLFFSPFTVAFRGLHIGNYGARETDTREFERNFTEEYLGSPYRHGFLRGYSFASFDECRQRACPEAERLRGTRVALASAEVRLPLFGNEQFGLIDLPYLPTELTVFADAGLAWTASQPPVFSFETDRDVLLDPNDYRVDPESGNVYVTRYPMVSVGTSARFNLLGAMVFEVFYAYPFQRPDKGGHFGLQFVPGW